MRILGLQLLKSSEFDGYCVLFDNSHGLDVRIEIGVGNLWHAQARIGGLVIAAPLRRTAEESAAALDDGLRALWASMASVLVERAQA